MNRNSIWKINALGKMSADGCLRFKVYSRAFSNQKTEAGSISAIISFPDYISDLMRPRL